MISIKKLEKNQIDIIVESFKNENWFKERKLFEIYLKEQNEGKRIVYCVFYNDLFCGYGTLKYQSNYRYFSNFNIPEISDLNVLPKYRKKGIASILLNILESEAFVVSKVVGIGVGLYSDYGSAQKLYVNRNYIPDGHGITYNYESITPGSQVILDDDLVLWFIKVKK